MKPLSPQLLALCVLGLLPACFEPVVARSPGLLAPGGQAALPDAGRIGPPAGPGEDAGAADSGPVDAGVPPEVDAGCDPRTCEAAGAECGAIGDGCGGELDCGACTRPLQCGTDGRPNRCAPALVCDAERWCWENPLPQGNDLEALRAFGARDLWAVAGPRVLRWDGERWSAPELPTTARLRTIWASATDDVWVGGAEGVLLHWDGADWERFPHPLWRSRAEILALWGSGPDDVWAATGGDGLATLLRWDGRRWRDARLEDPTTPSGQVLWGAGADEVWLGGARGRLHRWDGAAWHPVANPIEGTPRAVHGLWGSAADDLWAVADEGTTLHWDGVEWRSVPNPARDEAGWDLRAVWGTGPDEVWAVGARWLEGGVLLRWDGLEWTRASAPGMPGLTSLHGAGGAGWIGGEAGFVGPLAGEQPALGSGVRGHFRDVWWDGEADGWAAGDEGLLARWDGAEWREHPSPTSETLHALWGAGADDLWAVGGTHESAGVLLHWDGAAWSATSTPAGLRAVWGAAGDDVWAAGSTPAFLHWDGTRWSEVPRPASSCQTLSSLWGAASDDVWAVGECGTVLHWDGAAWSARMGVTSGTLLEVEGSGADAVWAIGSHGLYRFDGADWTEQGRPEALELLSALRVSQTGEVWLGGRGGLARREEDGGWSTEAKGVGLLSVARIRGRAGGELRVVSGAAIVRRGAAATR